jgi:hypothetical protein
MSDDWYAASLQEVGHVLDKFEHQKTVTVKADSDLVAALLGLLSAAPVVHMMAKGAAYATAAAGLLESSVGVVSDEG